jgi:glucans biosynthesis protein C
MPPERLHHLDNLRALAMLAGVLFHAALAYSPLLQPLFPTADRDNAVVVDVVIWLLHLFRMPLFFLISGWIAAQLVQRRGLGGLFRNRLQRIALPFLLCWPLIHWLMATLTLHAARTATHPSPMLQFLRGLLDGESGLPALPPGTGHLWFLYYLLLFTVLVWVARSFELGWLAARLRALAPRWILWLLPLLLAPSLTLVSAPHPAPESLLPQFWAIGYYGPFFSLGYLLQGAPAQRAGLLRPAPWLLLGSLLLYVPWWLLLERDVQSASATASWPVALLQGYISVWMTLACLAVGQRLLHRRQPWLQPLAEASYWTYVVHLPILFAIQYRLLDVEAPWWAKLLVAVLGTLAVCLLSYALLVRRGPLARLFGSARTVSMSAA